MRQFFVLILFASVITASCNVKKKAIKTYNQYVGGAPFDAIVVPGITYDTTGQDEFVMKLRVLWAKKLYDDGITKNIIFSGAAVRSPYKEGVVMKIMADSLGIPPDHTFSEIKAEHSVQNACYGWHMACGMGFTKVALATDPFQSYLLKSYVKHRIPNMAILPIAVDSSVLLRQKFPKINPQAAFVDSFISLDVREGFFKRLHGTLSAPSAPKD